MNESSYTCPACLAEWELIYNEEKTADLEPIYCPFCGEDMEYWEDAPSLA